MSPRRKTAAAPAAVLVPPVRVHVARDVEMKTLGGLGAFGKDVDLYRQPCGCGWIGTWWYSEVKARLSFYRHRLREALNAKPPATWSHEDKTLHLLMCGALGRSTDAEARRLLHEVEAKP